MAIRSFFDNNNGTVTGWNRMLSATNISAGSVVDHNGDVVTGVSITVPTTVMYNSSVGGGPASTSGDASWVSPSTHFSDRLQLDVVDTWLSVVYGGLDDETEYLVMVWGWLSGGGTRVTQGRVNGGTIQTLNTVNNTTDVMSFVVSPSSWNITLELARHSTSTSGPAYAQCVYIDTYVADASMTITTDSGELVAGNAFNILCENFAAAPDDATFAVNTLVSGTVVNSLSVAVSVTDNMDGTYDLDGTMPALPSTGSASGIRFTDAGASITHTISIDTV